MKYLRFFFVFFIAYSFSTLKAEELKLPSVTAEYVCNTKFIIGVSILETRTFQGKNKKRIDTVVDNIPQSVIIDYDKQIVTYVWPKTFSYLTVSLIKEAQDNLKKEVKITKLDKIKSDYLRGFEVDVYSLKISLPDGTFEESQRWISKHGITLKETGFIEGKEGKIHFYSEFSNVKVFEQDDKLFNVPKDFKIAPVEDLDDVNELLKTMVKRV
ncbi:MAG: hypothetical protein CMI97_05715 [Pelagibacteraceae bacterium]|nr:hypothetical protein [Pelagibacteraceae bacterium]|tara:strand:- start:1101 stop:1739 length:639 start_codon:yes stop_codon:yes gene_type:complete